MQATTTNAAHAGHDAARRSGVDNPSSPSSDAALQRTDVDTALASFTFASVAKLPMTSTTQSTPQLAPANVISSFFRSGSRPFGAQAEKQSYGSASTTSSTLTPGHGGEHLRQHTSNAQHAHEAAQSQLGNTGPARKRLADSNLWQVLDGGVTSHPVSRPTPTKRHRSEGPLISTAYTGNMTAKELLSSDTPLPVQIGTARSASSGEGTPPAASSVQAKPFPFPELAMLAPKTPARPVPNSSLLAHSGSGALVSVAPRLTTVAEIEEPPTSSPSCQRSGSPHASNVQGTHEGATGNPGQLEMGSKNAVHNTPISSPSMASEQPSPSPTPASRAVQTSSVNGFNATLGPLKSSGEFTKDASPTLDQDIANIHRWLTDQRTRWQRLQSALRSKEEDVSKLEHLKRVKDDELLNAKRRIDELVATVATQTANLSRFDEAMAEQRVENEQRNALLEQRAMELKQFQDDMAQTLKRDEEEKTRTQQELNAAREEVCELRAQRDAGVDTITEIKQRLEQAQVEVHELRQQLKNLQEEKLALNTKLIEHEKDAAHLTQRNAELQRLVEEEESSKSEAQRLHQGLSEERETLKAKVDALQKDIDSLCSQKQALDTERAALDEQLSSARDNERVLTERLCEAEAEFRLATERGSDLAQQVGELRANVDGLKTDLDQAIQHNKTLTTERDDASTLAARLQQELTAEQDKLSRAERELGELQKERLSLQERLESSDRRIAQLSADEANAHRDKAVAQAYLDSSRETVEELKELRKILLNQLEEKERQLSEYMKLSRSGDTTSAAELTKLQGKYEIASDRLATVSQQLVDSEACKAALQAEVAHLKESAQQLNLERDKRTEDIAALQQAQSELKAVVVERDQLAVHLEDRSREVDELKRRICEAKEELRLHSADIKEGRRALEREATLLARYQSGQLTEAETNLLAQAMASNAEQVARELSKRDNTVKGLEYEKRSLLDKLKKAQQEIEMLRRGPSASSKRSIPLPASEPPSETDTPQPAQPSRVRFTEMTMATTTNYMRGASGAEPRAPPAAAANTDTPATGLALLAQQFGARRMSKNSSSTRAASKAGTTSKLGHDSRDEDGLCNDASAEGASKPVEPAVTMGRRSLSRRARPY